jgi:hypothetical protein
MEEDLVAPGPVRTAHGSKAFADLVILAVSAQQ